MKKPNQTLINDAFKALAKGLTVICVRDTVIENYHAMGKLSDEEMKAFNIEVCNKLYEAMEALLDANLDQQAKNDLYKTILARQPTGWNEPENKGYFRIKKESE